MTRWLEVAIPPSLGDCMYSSDSDAFNLSSPTLPSAARGMEERQRQSNANVVNYGVGGC